MFPTTRMSGKGSGRGSGEAQAFDGRIPGAEPQGVSPVENVAASGRLYRRDRDSRQVANSLSTVGGEEIQTFRPTGHRGTSPAAVKFTDNFLVCSQASECRCEIVRQQEVIG